jgi:hypothetical protein
LRASPGRFDGFRAWDSVARESAQFIKLRIIGAINSNALNELHRAKRNQVQLPHFRAHGLAFRHTRTVQIQFVGQPLRSIIVAPSKVSPAAGIPAEFLPLRRVCLHCKVRAVGKVSAGNAAGPA